MRLGFPTNTSQGDGLCCRQSRWRGVVSGLVFCSILIGLPVVCWHWGLPWFVWGACALVAALIVPLVVLDAVAKFRATNWLMWVRPDGLWINLRSYQNRHLPEAATVLHLSFDEIASAHQHIEIWSTPADPAGTTPVEWIQQSLELTLASGDTREIAKALADERRRRATIRGLHQPVTVPMAGVIRIAWRGTGDDASPSLNRVLYELKERVKVTERTRTKRPDWTKLSEAELDDLIAQLLRSGDDIEASQLLIRRRGYSSNEAHKFLEELSNRI